jgi:shikimate dehydrogenase
MTRRVGLIGKPLKRRHSQVMHDAAFDAAGIDARYVLLELEPEAVESAVHEARSSPEWLGLGVTAPYKAVVAGLVDEVEADARTIGAVNNVVRTDDGRLIGFNTDAPGFRAGVELALGRPLDGLDVVVVGAGGAAHAVVYACLVAGARQVMIANRTVAIATVLAERFRGVGRGTVTAIDDTAVFAEALAGADLAVNATTVGMLDPGMTVPVDLLPATATVFDLVYVPAETPLLAAARARGLRAANGSEMLIAQAAIAFERWTGVGGMADVMRAAVAPLLADPTVTA